MSVSLPLCQPGAGASCGACCGLYNFRDHSRAALAAALARHSEALAGLPPTPAAWAPAAAALRAEDTRAPLFPAVRVCPLLGFLDAERTRVGCLAHPQVTGGVDLRDCGAYRAEVCEGFTCPSFSWLSDAQALLVRDACPDWYLYGLVITDVEFVRGCLGLLERALCRPLSPDVLRGHPQALTAVRALFALKETAAGRGQEARVFGRFGRDGAGEPTLRTLDYAALASHAAPEDEVVLCLGHAPADAAALEAARAEVRAHVQAVVEALGG